MHDALIAGLTGSKGTIRSLINQELPLLRDHLLRLDPEESCLSKGKGAEQLEFRVAAAPFPVAMAAVGVEVGSRP